MLILICTVNSLKNRAMEVGDEENGWYWGILKIVSFGMVNLL